MITISKGAVTELDAFFADKPKSCIRVYLAPGGCSGPRLALALDEAGEDDASFSDSGYDFCIAKVLLEQTGKVSIDVIPMGFIVASENPLPGGGGCMSGCGGGCTGCH